MEIYLNNFGTSVHVDNHQFVIVHSDGKNYIDPLKLRTIHVSKGAKITSDAVLLAIENEIDVIFHDNTGMPKGRVWSVNYGSISTIRQRQIEFVYSSRSVEWIKGIIVQKIENQIALLYALIGKHVVDEQMFEKHKELNKTIQSLKDYITKINQLQGNVVSDIAASLRGWEGVASRKYFSAISMLLPEKYQYKERSQHPALDAFNSLLNYGYGILYGKIEGALIKAGIDPYVGVFHRENYNRPVLVFDVIELFRSWIDYVVVDLCCQEVVSEEWFKITEDGVYWLEALGKRILIQSVSDYFNEVINIDQKERTRNTQIELYAQQLARLFENFKTE